jgi:colicin import membrane protein
MLKKRSAYVKRVIRMNALRKGLLGGQPLWRAVYVASALRKMWGKVSKKGEAPITFSESLGQGEAWAIVHVPEDSKQGRGEGRKFLVGPKRKPARFAAIGPAAVVAASRRVLEAPDAARVNQILGVDVVEDEPPTKRQRKRAKANAKAHRKATAKQDAKDARTARSLEKSNARDEEQARKAARAQAKADAKRDKAELRAAARAARKEPAPTDEVTNAGPLQKSDA